MASNPSDVSNARGQSESTDEDQKTPSICPGVSAQYEIPRSARGSLLRSDCRPRSRSKVHLRCRSRGDAALFALLRCILHPNRRRTDL